MSLSKKSRRGLVVFSTIQMSVQRIKYLVPQLDLHTKALKMNERFDIEKKQKENQHERINHSTRS
jgi:hypothetical protein